jgi:hypothetical protein
MGIVKGLKAINQHFEAEEAKFSKSDDDAPKTRWLVIKDKQAFKIAFLQEMDVDSDLYSTKNDVGFVATEHKSPANFRIKALCTADEGNCYGCEQHEKDYKAKWGQKSQLYINVLVDEGKGEEPYVAVLSQGNGDKSITKSFLEYAGLVGKVTDKWFQLKRTGSGQKDTSYLLTPLNDHGLNVESYTLFDLDKVVYHVPYEEQEKFYNRDGAAQSVENAPRESEPPTVDSVNSEW